jgi:lipoprotein-anchoring transpeptidase ErfK/SrfK
MIRWVVRLLAFATLVWVGTLVVDAGHHDASAQRIVSDASAQPVSKAKPDSVAKKAAKAARTTHADLTAASKCAGVTASHEIIVSIKKQELWACSGATPFLQTKVTTGAIQKDWATPKGTWQIYAKQTNRWLSGVGYSVEVHYWMPFWGGYGLHDSPWQKFPYGSSLYRSQGSHGCVQIPLATMAKIFNWAPVGATVHVEA